MAERCLLECLFVNNACLDKRLTVRDGGICFARLGLGRLQADEFDIEGEGLACEGMIAV